MRWGMVLPLLLLPALGAPAACLSMPVQELADRYRSSIDKTLAVPPEEALDYALRLDRALGNAVHRERQFAILVDRSTHVQAVFVYWGAPGADWQLIGASPASTGLPGRVDYFETPLGVFEHTLGNPDFRAEGTLNKNGIRGYGVKGMRVYDFGWASSPRTWGTRGPGTMRLQMHATDPDALEPLLGTRRSKGCIRIPASLNVFIDHHGLLDADYERAIREGRSPWVLRPTREPTPWSGRYLVVVDSGRTARPDWSPLPEFRRRKLAEASHDAC